MSTSNEWRGKEDWPRRYKGDAFRDGIERIFGKRGIPHGTPATGCASTPERTSDEPAPPCQECRSGSGP